MTGSMYAAIAGLRTHMQNLNVIGNNVANVNTQSYKSARSVFKTSIYTTISGGSDGTEVVGGANPSQIGYGANMASVDIDMSTGNYAVTGNPTDMMIDGDGFFLMGNKDVAATFEGDAGDVNKLTSLTLTRLGNFAFKADGYLTNDDLCVYGFMCTGIATEADVPEKAKKVGDPMFSDQLVPIRYPRVKVETRYYDKEGNIVTLPDDVEKGDDGKPTAAALTAAGVATQADVPVIKYASDIGVADDDDNNAGGGGAGGGAAAGDAAARTYKRLDDYHEFDDDGNRVDYAVAQFNGITVDKKTGLIYGISNDTSEVVYIGCVAIGQVTNPNGVTQIGSSYYTAGPGSGDLTISVLGGGASEMGIDYVNKSLTLAAAGIGPDGAADDNNNNNAGDATEPDMIDGLRIRTGGKTGLQTNGLEMSKTDLAQEIANMILTQRGYQANTRIITVTDSMLEELVNMKR